MAKRACILVAQDFQDMEVMYPYYRLKEAGHEVIVAGTGEKELHGKYGYPIQCDRSISEVEAEEFDLFLVPGGWAPDFMRRSEHAAKLIQAANEKGKLIAAICHAGWVLASAKMLKGKRMTSFHAIRDDLENAGADWVDEPVVVDGNLISARNPDDLPEFMKNILAKLETL